MMPSKGRTVLYYFTHHEFTEHRPGVVEARQEVRSRPAMVIGNTGDRADLQVFWHPADRASSTVTLLIPAHHEPTGEIGKVERMTPQPGTWSWLPGMG